MRIERVSDTQIRFILMSDDLVARNIHVDELHYSSEKTQQLFREIMELVQDECDFRSTQMMLEAKWDGDGRVVVMVTKLAEPSDEEESFDLTPPARTHGRFKRAGLMELTENAEEESHSIFSFGDMELAAAAAARLHTDFKGPSRLYKMEGRYYLWFQNETGDGRTTPELELILHEFGQKHVSGNLSHHYLEEHSEPIITEGAVEKLSHYHTL
ncbi:MAG: adaptor protein MecA [Defluviitaleaceae bacterium]|nr:adaptor protein MecA [Defluviitaleaceae bacterium]MCL2240395.1 adaptor protein MecA [Defluviitaleaceae bacterium]